MSDHATQLLEIGSLRGDDGFGVEVVRRLGDDGGIGPGVELLEVGTAGIRLAQDLLTPCDFLIIADAMTRANSTDGQKVRDALATANVPGVTGILKMNAQRNVDKPAVIQEVTFKDGEAKFVYKTTINPG